MENRSYAFFLPEQNTEKRKNMQILLSLSGINTPILQGESISGKADKFCPRAQTWFSKTKKITRKALHALFSMI
jgi:hypothetical protein